MQSQHQPQVLTKINAVNLDEVRQKDKNQSQLAYFQTLTDAKTEGEVINIVDIDKVLSQLRSIIETMIKQALAKDESFCKALSNLIDDLRKQGEKLLNELGQKDQEKSRKGK